MLLLLLFTLGMYIPEGGLRQTMWVPGRTHDLSTDPPRPINKAKDSRIDKVCLVTTILEWTGRKVDKS